MKVNYTKNHRRQAFTLIEMIGVLAVIAILAALLIPKVFSSINAARVNGVTVSLETIKSAVADHYGKYGSFNTIFGTNALSNNGGVYTNNFDNVLLTEGLLDKPFTVKIATNAVIRLVAGGTDDGGSGYALDGVNISTTNSISYVVEAALYGVSQQDAKDLNDLIDGQALGAPSGSDDTKGRVEYRGTGSGNTVTVYVYITHR